MWVTVYLAGQVALWSWMRGGSVLRRVVVGAMVGLLYESVLGFLSIGAAGGGHGTSIPLFLSSAPLGAFFWVVTDVGREAAFNAMLFGGLLIWAALGSLAVLSRRGKGLVQVLGPLHDVSWIASR